MFIESFASIIFDFPSGMRSGVLKAMLPETRESSATSKRDIPSRSRRLRSRRFLMSSGGGLHPTGDLRASNDELDKRKVDTPRGGAWHPQLVKRIVERLPG
jgi:hypothetical protein